MSASGVITGNAAGSTVIVRLTEANGLKQSSVAVQVSVIVPPHGPGVAEKVDRLDVPLIRHPTGNPFVNGTVLGTIAVPQGTEMSARGVITGNAAGSTVIVRLTEASGLKQSSVAVQVSVIVPPHGPGVAEKVDRLDVPLIRHPTGSPLVNGTVVGTIAVPQGTEISASGVITGNAAGSTVIVRLTEASGLKQSSVAVQVSVIVPPHGPGVAEKVDRFEVPLIRHPTGNPFVNGTVVGTIAVPQGTEMSASGVITGKVAGFTWMILEVVIVFPQTTAVQVSVTFPPQASGMVPSDEVTVPLILQGLLSPLS
jgi:uncharacterized protein YidB (DUF937 family)